MLIITVLNDVIITLFIQYEKKNAMKPKYIFDEIPGI